MSSQPEPLVPQAPKFARYQPLRKMSEDFSRLGDLQKSSRLFRLNSWEKKITSCYGSHWICNFNRFLSYNVATLGRAGILATVYSTYIIAYSPTIVPHPPVMLARLWQTSPFTPRLLGPVVALCACGQPWLILAALVTPKTCGNLILILVLIEQLATSKAGSLSMFASAGPRWPAG